MRRKGVLVQQMHGRLFMDHCNKVKDIRDSDHFYFILLPFLQTQSMCIRVMAISEKDILPVVQMQTNAEKNMLWGCKIQYGHWGI